MKKYLMWNDHDQQFYADPTIAGSITTKIGDVMGAGQKIIEIDMSKIKNGETNEENKDTTGNI